VAGLLDEEEAAILSLDMSKGRVIATGGSAVLREKSAEHLRENSVCVYLSLSLSEIEKRVKNRSTRGIAAEKNQTLSDIYAYRVPFYEKYADITVLCAGKAPEENVNAIKEFVKKN
jgi:shikimate kinase